MKTKIFLLPGYQRSIHSCYLQWIRAYSWNGSLTTNKNNSKFQHKKLEKKGTESSLRWCTKNEANHGFHFLTKTHLLRRHYLTSRTKSDEKRMSCLLNWENDISDGHGFFFFKHMSRNHIVIPSPCHMSYDHHVTCYAITAPHVMSSWHAWFARDLHINFITSLAIMSNSLEQF